MQAALAVAHNAPRLHSAALTSLAAPRLLCSEDSTPGASQNFIMTLVYKMKRIADAVLRWAFFSLNLFMLALYIAQN